MTARDRFTAADVARFCGVDLKTIHNWASKGKLPHERTEGRHLRFRRVELVAFLRAYEMRLPAALRDARPEVVLASSDPATTAAAKRALARRFEVSAFARAVDALVALGAQDPDAFVLDLAIDGLDAREAIAALRASPATRHLAIVALGADEAVRDRAMAAGASAFVQAAQVSKLRDALEELTGLSR